MSRRRRQRQRRMAYINFAIIALLIAGGVAAFQFLKPVPYDEQTLCLLSDELPPHTAIILDKTDEYDESQADLIADLIRRSRDRLEVGERLSMFELDAEGQFDPRGEFSLCNPGRGGQVNPLFRNPRMIEERYATLFETPMDAVIDDLVVPKEAPSSPILEAMARLGQTENFSPDAPARRIVIVSDMPETAKTDAINDINHALKSDQLRHRIAGEFSLDDIAGAHELIEQGNVRGCVVVNVSE